MTIDPLEQSDVAFFRAQICSLARQMNCRDAAKFLHGFLVVTDPELMPEVRALYHALRDCDAQLQLLTTPAA